MRVFVIMPIGDRSLDEQHAEKFACIYDAIHEAVVNFRLEDGLAGSLSCKLASQDTRTGDIIAHILGDIASSDIVIADISDNNPNVLYELGVRHSVRDGTIIITQDLAKAPFDLKTLRILPYSYSIAGLQQLRRDLHARLYEVLKPRRVPDSPVLRYLREIGAHSANFRPTPQWVNSTDLIQTIEASRLALIKVTGQARGLAESFTARPQEAQRRQRPIRLTDSIWTTEDGSRLYVLRKVGGEFIGACGSRGENADLLGTFHNVKSAGDRVVGRFRWVNDSAEGCVSLESLSSRRLEGGWWYIQDTPDVSLSGSPSDLASMNPLTLVRTRLNEPLPRWAELFFGGRQQ